MEARLPPMSGLPSTTFHHAGRADVNFGAGLIGTVEPKPDRDAAPFVFAQGTVVVGVFFGGLQALRETDAAERGAVDRVGAFLGGVFQAQFQGVHVQLLRQFVECAFASEHGLAAHRARGRRPRAAD